MRLIKDRQFMLELQRTQANCMENDYTKNPTKMEEPDHEYYYIDPKPFTNVNIDTKN